MTKFVNIYRLPSHWRYTFAVSEKDFYLRTLNKFKKGYAYLKDEPKFVTTMLLEELFDTANEMNHDFYFVDFVNSTIKCASNDVIFKLNDKYYLAEDEGWSKFTNLDDLLHYIKLEVNNCKYSYEDVH